MLGIALHKASYWHTEGTRLAQILWSSGDRVKKPKRPKVIAFFAPSPSNLRGDAELQAPEVMALECRL